MLQAIYRVLTTHVGMYLCYVIPIVYFLVIVLGSVVSRLKERKAIGAKGIAAVVAIGVILLDFVNFLYLFSSGTGTVLPSATLFAKYALGFLFWLWVLWYSYEVYFSRRAAGELFTKRMTILAIVCAGSLLLGGIGIMMS